MEQEVGTRRSLLTKRIDVSRIEFDPRTFLIVRMQQGGHRPGDSANQIDTPDGLHARRSLDLPPYRGNQDIEAESICRHPEVAVSPYLVDLHCAGLSSPRDLKICKAQVRT